jgi:nicotinamide-nucleotide amidase
MRAETMRTEIRVILQAVRGWGGRAWQRAGIAMIQGMRMELITTGSELLLGQVMNSHPGYLSGRLEAMGLSLARQTAVPDGREAIREVLAEGWGRCDFLLVTGGLGPTSDDVTREVVAEFLGKPLEYHPEIHEKILAYFRSRNLTPPEMVKVQAMVPKGMVVLPNEHGTAPGLLWEENGKMLVLLPGPPRELAPMYEAYVEPRLRGSAGKAVGTRILRVHGQGESFVQEKCEAKLRSMGVEEIGYCARPGEVDLRVKSAEVGLLERAVAKLREILGEAVYAEGRETMEEVVVKLARGKGVKLATAESCTGGLVANRITDVPGASEVFLGGWVTYSNEAKVRDLEVSEDSLRKYGAVSAAVAGEMAQGARKRSGADWAVSVTGIAGPGGGSPGKPVGLVYLGIAGEEGVETIEKKLVPERKTFKAMASQSALDLLRRKIQKGAHPFSKTEV